MTPLRPEQRLTSLILSKVCKQISLSLIERVDEKRCWSVDIEKVGAEMSGSELIASVHELRVTFERFLINQRVFDSIKSFYKTY